MFRIEYGEKSYWIVTPNGENGELVSFCSPASAEYLGEVYCAYLTAEDADNSVDPGPDAANYLDPANPHSKVYKCGDWPNLFAVPTESIEVEFEEDEEDDEPNEGADVAVI